MVGEEEEMMNYEPDFSNRHGPAAQPFRAHLHWGTTFSSQRKVFKHQYPRYSKGLRFNSLFSKS
jgi:hypothetical protein